MFQEFPRSLVGEEAVVVEEVDNARGTGYVLVDGKRFPARSLSGTVVSVGTRVLILGIDGIRLLI
ncbi:MAG: NfeD family protein [Thermaerobacter sp.]|jgi:membrane protein implicated in regulation of membrane protease activity|nr:NfeD family protein [Thermaerobacter sp.]MDA8146174.1 NfeD family protein [Thermaerobacter sp.]